MSGEFAYTDLVILALVAGFILLRLRGILGQNPELPERKVKEEPKEAAAQPQRRAAPVEEPEEEPLPASEHSASGLPTRLKEVRRLDPSFRLRSFLEGAKTAFEMVLDAFSQGDRKLLKSLLSPEVFEGFSQEIKTRKATDRSYETTLISFKDVEVVDAEVKGSVIQLSVRFVSEQVNLVRDANGAIVEGDPSEIEQVTDVWTFERDSRSTDPNWKLVATHG